MPKETIYGAWRVVPLDTKPEDIEATTAPWRVDVAWGHETSVQLATLTHDGFGIKTVDPESPDGLWVILERDSINRLIKALRKARDQAFGEDA